MKLSDKDKGMNTKDENGTHEVTEPDNLIIIKQRKGKCVL